MNKRKTTNTVTFNGEEMFLEKDNAGLALCARGPSGNQVIVRIFTDDLSVYLPNTFAFGLGGKTLKLV